jgi:hypothetical protein
MLVETPILRLQKGIEREVPEQLLAFSISFCFVQ